MVHLKLILALPPSLPLSPGVLQDVIQWYLHCTGESQACPGSQPQYRQANHGRPQATVEESSWLPQCY